MPASQKCSYCGTEVPAEASATPRTLPDGGTELLPFLCPRCLMARGTEGAAGPSGTVVVSMLPSEQPGDRIGRYKLIQEIGAGSFGVVYLAEQEQPVKRKVALKIIKLGMDTREVIARFDAERQALALMDHPNIAKVLDAGATDSGRPFFVMEWVKGRRITDYCDEYKLTTRERLELFIKVCQAIQHAHQKGIIHRDIKPSNTLVTLHEPDMAAVPKVIDFGIAKATQGKLTDLTLYTAVDQFIGTPAYMSPEQAQMSLLDVDTRSDIYSLGVLLYELLSGRTPFDAKALMMSGLDVIRKTIREHDPKRPSTQVATLQPEDLKRIAHFRSTDSGKLTHQLRGDLDWIVMKCLEKDRARRYETANALAMDLRRHLNNDAVLARPPTISYRLAKAFQRHKLVAVAGGAIAAALILGVVGTTLGLLRAEKQRQEAQRATLAESDLKEVAVKALAAEKMQRERAQAEELAARRTAYSSDINLASQALLADNLGRAQRLLDRQRPSPGQQDLRDWEWRYLWSQTRADDHEVLLAGTDRILAPLSFSAQGWLLARENNGETVVMDLISRRVVLSRPNAWRPVFEHHATVLAFTEAASNYNVIVLLDMATGKETRLQTSWRQTKWIGFTPDDRHLLTVSLPANGDVREASYDVTDWDLASGTQLWQSEIGVPDTMNGRPYAISPDGTAFAAVLPGGRVCVLDVQDGRRRFAVKTTAESSITVQFSPDSATLLTGAGYTDSAIRLWDAQTGQSAGSLAGHRSWVSDLIFTPDGRRLISSSGDQTIRLWDWPGRRPAGVLRGHLDEVDGLALASDGQTLASRCKDGSIYLWNVNKPPRNLGYKTLPSQLAGAGAFFTPDGKSIVAAKLDGSVAQWDAATLKETRCLWDASTNHSHVSVSPDTRWLLQRAGEKRLAVWDTRTGLAFTNFQAAPAPFLFCMTRNGKFLLTVFGPSAGAAFEIRDTRDWSPQGFLTAPIEWMEATSLPNSFATMTGQTLRLFDASRPNQAPKQILIPGDVLDFDASPDGRLLAVACEDGSVRLWNLATLKPVETLKDLLLSANSVVFSPDGRRMAVGSSGVEAVKLWDAQTMQEVLTLSGQGSGFEGLRFSPDGRFLLAVNEAGLAHLWFAPSWDEIKAAEAEQKEQAQR